MTIHSRLWFYACAVAGLLAVVPVQAQSIPAKPSSGNPLAAAMGDMKANRHNRAIKKLSSAISTGTAKGPMLAKALYLRGKAYHAAGKHGQAIADLTNATYLNGLKAGERSDALATRSAAYKAVGLASKAPRSAPRARTVAAAPVTRPASAPTRAKQSAPAPAKQSAWRQTTRAAGQRQAPSISTIASAPAPNVPEPVKEKPSGGFFSNLFSGGSGTSSRGPVTAESLSEAPADPPVRVRKPVPTVAAVSPPVTPRVTAPVRKPVPSRVAPPQRRTQTAALAPRSQPKPATRAPSAWSTDVSKAPTAAPPAEPSAGNAVSNFFGTLFGGRQGSEDTTASSSALKPAVTAPSRPAQPKVVRRQPVRVARAAPASPRKPAPPARKPAPSLPAGPGVSEPLIETKTARGGAQRNTGSTTIQVASLRSQGEALRVVRRLNRVAPGVTQTAAPQVAPTVIGNMGTFYRVTLGPFASDAAGKQACATLRSNGLDCFVLDK